MRAVKSRREENSEATRAALLSSATTLFTERGFVGTSLDDVANATRVTRGAVYHHFDGKQALFEAVLNALEERAQEHILAAGATTEDPWEAALAGLEAFLEQCCDPVYGRVVIQEGPLALGWSRWRECEEKYAYGLTENFLRMLMEAGYLAPSPLQTTTQIVFGMLSAAAVAIGEAAADDDKARVRGECSTLLRDILTGLRLPGPAQRHGG